MSTASRHSQLAELFAEATSLPGDRRNSFVGDLDESIRVELSALLRFHETLHALDLSGDSLRDWLDAPPTDLPAATRVGEFVIEHLLGRGGGGAVYAARQTGALERDVALKILDLPESITEPGRFAAERNAMAMLDHPGIARIYDADVDDAGRAFIAMERVAGVPIDQWHAGAKPTTRQTIELILRIGEALEYAHGRGVIHRDIKPSNLLVAGPANAAVVKVIDFGLVAAAAGSTLRRWLDVDHAQFLGGTPLFMAPEQATPDALPDVRADVYGLGAVAFALLSGKPPLDLSDLSSGSTIELLHAVRDRERMKLSDVAPDVPHDLSLVIDKALGPFPSPRVRSDGSERASPDRRGESSHALTRYENMTAFLADLRRFQNDRPVAARRPTRAYAMRLFIRRHRAGVLVGAAISMLLLGGAIGTISGYLRARAENERYRAGNQTNTALSEFLTDDLLGAAIPESAGRDAKIVDLLDRAGDSLKDRFADRPMIEANLRLTLGETYMHLGELQKSQAMLARGLELTEKNAPGNDPQHVRALASLGVVESQLSHFDLAQQLCERAIAAGGEEAACQYPVAAAHEALADLLDERGKWDDAIHHIDIALHLFESQYQNGSGPKLKIAESLSNRSVFLSDAGRTAEAAAAEKALPGQVIALLGPDHIFTAEISANHASTLLDENKNEEALPLLDQAFPKFQKEFGPKHPNTLKVMGNLISALVGTGQIERAIPMCRELIPLVDEVVGPRTADAVRARHRLVAALLVSDHAADALEPSDDAARAALAVYGDNHWMTGECLAARGYALETVHRFAEAKEVLFHARAVLVATRGADDARVKGLDEHLAAIAARTATTTTRAAN